MQQIVFFPNDTTFFFLWLTALSQAILPSILCNPVLPYISL